MLYLIGGPPRMGKSTMAQRLLANLTVPYVSTDGLTVMLKPMGEPSFYSPEKAARFYPMLDGFISRMIKVCPDYAIEGDAFSPHHVDALKEKYEIHAVFLGMSTTSSENILKYTQYDDWASQNKDEEFNDLIRRIAEASAVNKTECEHFGIPYFDLSEDYDAQFLAAYNSLVGKIAI